MIIESFQVIEGDSKSTHTLEVHEVRHGAAVAAERRIDSGDVVWPQNDGTYLCAANGRSYSRSAK